MLPCWGPGARAMFGSEESFDCFCSPQISEPLCHLHIYPLPNLLSIFQATSSIKPSPAPSLASWSIFDP